ncbi:CPBP family intramembrane metalloprotease [Leuconostoc mesenteroides]|uniref:CPBP family intramembrane glutamic endopeptidase n=1 Tax=Leuconostoc mesenteroides TaxID=1245 RepID=UPI001B8D2955|nr:CPBP family intramembrane glutamic endopeptidase [Leuconostoc mesenteroides]MBS0942097.1 CPBP family intramembrane metalloprotease [Leuconostoc mesenteroides]
MVRKKYKPIMFLIKNMAIIITFFIGISMEPYSPDQAPLKNLIIITFLLIVCIYIFSRLVNSISNHGRLFVHRIELSTFQKYSSLLAFGYFILLYIINENIQSMLHLFQSSPEIIVTCTAIALGAGFLEEYLVRGYLFNLTQRFLKKYNNKLLITSIVTSIIFGLLHLFNLGLDTTKGVAQQVFYAFCIGLFFSLVKIITNSIHIGAILHFLFDLQFGIYENTSTHMSWSVVILLFLPLAVISVILIKSLEATVNDNQNLLMEV